MPTLAQRLREHRRTLDDILSYEEFRRHAIDTGWLPILIRSCGEHERRWERWLQELKCMSDGLLSLVEEGQRRDLAFLICGI